MRVQFEKACELLNHGDVVAIPTETVYGLAASLSCVEAIEHIFTLKGRPQDNPLIIHVADSTQVNYYTKNLPEGFSLLASTFWPGPMTLVLPVEKDWVPHVVRAGLETVAFRIPSHPLTLQVLEQVGPLVMPSANLSGKPSATRPEHIENDFGGDIPILDGGESHCGVESTILAFREGKWEIVRLGALSPEAFEPFIGYQPEVTGSVERPICPGQMYKHYAPQTELLLGETLPEDVEVILGFQNREYPKECQLFSLGSDYNAEEVAKNLYQVLRNLDRDGVKQAWVDLDFPKEGLWKTVEERLKKASSS